MIVGTIIECTDMPEMVLYNIRIYKCRNNLSPVLHHPVAKLQKSMYTAVNVIWAFTCNRGYPAPCLRIALSKRLFF